MHALLNQNNFFVKEHVGMLKAANNYDILNPQNLEEIWMECREAKLGGLAKLLRFTKYKAMTPFNIEVKSQGTLVCRVNRPWTF